MERLDVGLLCNAPTQRLKDGLSLFENLGLYRAMTIFGAAYGVKIGIFGIDDLQVGEDELHGTAIVWQNGTFEIVEAKLPQHLESIFTINKRFMSPYPQEIGDALIRKNISKINPTKDKIPQILFAAGLAEYAIPSITASCFEEICRGIAMWKNCVVKPINGKRGRGVLYAEYADGKLLYESVQEKAELTQESWEQYCRSVPQYKEFLVQPRLNFHNRAGQAIDFRVLVSKGGNGTWEIVDIYVRHGLNHLVSNVAEGGLLGSAKEYLKSEFGDEDRKLYQILCDLGTKVPQAYELALQDRAESFYGIDVGIDLDTLTPYVIEVNAFPGTCFHKYHLAEKRVQYYQYLISQE